ncbi:MAG: cytochrome c [Desulfuromonadales bacterium]|nr:cytochrome c [Desulfuromonadales bacterium]
MKALVTGVLILLLGALAVSPVLGAGSGKVGKEIFRSKCRSCHVKGGEGGDLAPASKTQMQWRRFMKKDQHRIRPEVWKGLAPQEMDHLWRFFYENSLDSDRPHSCG